MNAIKNISPWQFTIFRMIFGGYLLIHFLNLIPWAGELFSSNGTFPDPSLNFTHGLLPNPLEHWQSPLAAQVFLGALAALSLMFAMGTARRTCAVLLWYGWACLFNRNNLISNPGIPYVGLLLLLCAIVPRGEPLTPGRRRPAPWQMPALVFWGAWFLMVAGYTFSGAWKLASPSWIDGSALAHLLHNPLARPGFLRDILLAFPEPFLKALTWIALAGELLALPLSCTRRGRAVAWLWMIAMHLGILLVVDFADLTFGVLMIHLFTFDPEWLPARAPRSRLVLFDGVCGLCERSVRFFVDIDPGGVLRFAPLQGSTAAPILKRHGLDQAAFRTIIVVDDEGTDRERIYVRSDGVALALSSLGGIWRVLSWLLRLVPRPWRDAAYSFVAKRRHDWFPKDDACPLPSPGQASRFLP